MNYSQKPTKKTIRLDPGDAEWDGGTALVAKYIEPVGYNGDFCAQGTGDNASHGATGEYSATDGECVNSPQAYGPFSKVFLSSTSANAIIIHAVEF